jgi:signal transduction histidine kinase
MADLTLKHEPVTELAQQHAKSILIVDDESIIRDLCARALKGYRIVQASDGEEALRVFAEGGIDVVLTDVMMPRMGGIELLKRLKESEPTLVVIVMTGFAEKDVILNALKADADDFITKPLNLLQLKTAVDKALVKKALKEEIASLKSADRLKSNFLSIVSHKFRTPITAISLFLQNLNSGVYDPNDPDSRENLRLTYEESCYLGHLVEDLLAFSKVMDQGGLKLEPCSLNGILVDILAVSKEAVSHPGVETRFDLEELPPLLLDREKITFALKQVLDNAYKFSRTKGTVSISLAMDNGIAKIVIEDQGGGIGVDDLPRIFDKFYQVDPFHSGQIRGFGLGLYYAREFIRMHSGSIVVDSRQGEGTRVTISIPAHF